ncbi:hypothetical protein KQI88_10490 [Alkaliphilus sp. MSJ-5]|uniref:DUF1540 domain-containing protein n=1 Tax=Alkaliphilus flagellatus TaxID=2841507 RepID=A0ABS6G645_9FIRM|nr:hypothetical protein [Alkaliphilus flagellatus]MBU5676846.1 hypothetical protein [Alkaliphilus flagellatus]
MYKHCVICGGYYLGVQENCPCQENEEDICDYSLNNKCMHTLSEGELDCNGTDEEMAKCMCHVELV